MRNYLSESVGRYLNEVAARTIVPGGGSAAAVEAALGVALNLMVINYSIKPSLSDAAKKDLLAIKKLQEKTLKTLVKLASRDSEAFTALMKALSSGKPARKAYVRAAAVPLEVCKVCLVSVEVSLKLLAKGNRNLLTDIGCASHMLSSAFRSARLNVLVNLKYMGGAFARKAAKDLSVMGKYVDGAESRISAGVLKALKPEA